MMYMDKMESFKKFAANKPFLKKKVDKKETSWLELFERYDIYGEDDPIFKEETETKSNTRQDTSFNSFVDMLNSIDIDKISEGLNGMKKVLSILSEITKKEDVPSKSKMNRPYERDVD